MEGLIDTAKAIASAAPGKCDGCYMVELKSQALARAILRSEHTIDEARAGIAQDIGQNCVRGVVECPAESCFPEPNSCSYSPIMVQN